MNIKNQKFIFERKLALSLEVHSFDIYLNLLIMCKES